MMDPTMYDAATGLYKADLAAMLTPEIERELHRVSDFIAEEESWREALAAELQKRRSAE